MEEKEDNAESTEESLGEVLKVSHEERGFTAMASERQKREKRSGCWPEVELGVLSVLLGNTMIAMVSTSGD